MPVAIRRGQTFLCTTNTALPRWGSLERMSALKVFPSREAAEDYMDNCSTIEFNEDDEVVQIAFKEIAQ